MEGMESSAIRRETVRGERVVYAREKQADSQLITRLEMVLSGF